MEDSTFSNKLILDVLKVLSRSTVREKRWSYISLCFRIQFAETGKKFYLQILGEGSETFACSKNVFHLSLSQLAHPLEKTDIE